MSGQNSSNYVLYGLEEDEETLIPLKRATANVDPSTRCMSCKLLNEEFVGATATDENVERVEKITDDYHHTLGPSCEFRKPILDDLSPHTVYELSNSDEVWNLRELYNAAI